MTGERNLGERTKLRVLCLHGFRTSGSILEKQLSKWSSSIHELLDLTFLDAPYPAKGKSDVEGFFPPPYYEWFQYNHDFTEYTGFDETVQFIANFMENNGPFDGLLGFSQGSILSSALVGMQEKGKALTGIPPVKFVISVSGAKLIASKFAFVYSDGIRRPSVHVLGDKDWLRTPGEELLKAYESPLVIRHPKGHTVPRLGNTSCSFALSKW
ncbi:hypothetical protein SELMODRAFT_128834 [Selaginella moellendorffii]|uniref:Serine hydrolase domain-containing protein n=1 Tax=Selaginella moellendorffii TaxID=88036 RepID=D8SZP5_SELML|nr:hypothetical protein SELMODRAFT_128834 [Selaginella moellendorffii]